MKKMLFATFALLATQMACAEDALETCQDFEGIYDIQYRYELEGEDYFIIFVWVPETNSVRRLFGHESTQPIGADVEVFEGDPTGRFFAVEISEQQFVIPRLDLEFNRVDADANCSSGSDACGAEFDATRGLLKFSEGGREYELVSCNGLFSRYFFDMYESLEIRRGNSGEFRGQHI